MDFDYLLGEYRTIWNNRKLEKENESSEEILIQLMERELLDENSHPRARRNRYEKYYLSVKRLTESDISHEGKLQLIELYNQIMEALKEGE